MNKEAILMEVLSITGLIWEAWVKKMESAGYSNARKIQEEAIRLVKVYSAGKTDQWRTMFPQKTSGTFEDGCS